MSSDPPPPAQTNNYSDTMRESLQAQIDLAPQIYQAELGNVLGADGEYVKGDGGSRSDYARLERQILGENLFGKGGITELLAGAQERSMPDGTTRKPGYDANGNFMGTAGLEEDMRQIQQKAQVEGDISLVAQNQDRLTQALRGSRFSGLNQAITGATNELTSDTQSGLTRLSPTSNSQMTKKAYAGVKKIGGPQQTSEFGEVQDGGKINTKFNTNFINNGGVASDVYTDSNKIRDISSDTSFDAIIDSSNAIDVSSGNAVGVNGINSSAIDAGQLGDLGGLRSSLSSQAMSDLALGGNLSDEERRMVQEDARASATARGRGRDTASIVDEVANLESARRQRQNERRGFAQGIAGQEAQMEQFNLSNQMQASQLNQSSDLRAQEINQGNMLQADLSNVSNQMRADELNQNRDLQQGARQLSAQQSNQQADLASRDRAQQGQLAGIARDQSIKDRQLQADLANQRNSMDNVNRNFQKEQFNQSAIMQNNDMTLRAEQAEAQRIAQLNSSQLQRDASEAQRIEAQNQANFAVDAQNQQTQMNQISAVTQNSDQNIDRELQAQIANNQSYMQAVGMDRASALNRVNMEQSTSADAMLALTGRPSGQSTTVGQSSFGNSGALAGAGPKLYNPAQGAEFMANQSAMLNSYNSATYGAQQQMKGAIIGGVASGLGAIGGGFASR